MNLFLDQRPGSAPVGGFVRLFQEAERPEGSVVVLKLSPCLRENSTALNKLASGGVSTLLHRLSRFLKPFQTNFLQSAISDPERDTTLVSKLANCSL